MWNPCQCYHVRFDVRLCFHACTLICILFGLQQLAGFNRLILALRANTVPHVHTLLLSRNGLPAAVVGLLEGCLAAGGLGKLKYLDLRFNNLGDQGAQVHHSCLHSFIKSKYNH